MTDLALAVLIPGTIIVALTVDLIALAAWVRRMARQSS
jgi:hypothetical protein